MDEEAQKEKQGEVAAGASRDFENANNGITLDNVAVEKVTGAAEKPKTLLGGNTPTEDGTKKCSPQALADMAANKKDGEAQPV